MTGEMVTSRHVVMSGCSGGGKSTLLAELARRGYPTVPEPGRRIVEEELRGDGRALPWVDLSAFAVRAIRLARADREAVDPAAEWVFFDRGLIDAAVALQHATGQPAFAVLNQDAPYHRKVFMTPPWPEIFATDRERRHEFEEAVDEHHRLLQAYEANGYQTILLPKIGIVERAEFVLHHLP